MNKLFSVESTELGYLFRILGIKIKIRKRLNNQIYLVSPAGNKKKVRSVKGLKIKFYGADNLVEIKQPITFRDSLLTLSGSGNHVKIEQSKYCLKELKIFCAEGSKLSIGKDLSTVGCSIAIHGAANMKVKIGDDCLFGVNVYIRPADGHTIFDKISGKIINNNRTEISIGNHVWLGRNVTVTKGAVIPNNTVVGINSMVNKNFEEENTIIAGSPAKVIKQNIGWNRKSIPEFLNS